MQALKTLPPHYKLYGTLDLSKNKLVATGMNIVAAGFFLLFGWTTLLFLSAVRPDTGAIILQVGGRLETIGTLGAIAVLIVLQIVMVILHEFAHGLFFWYFTRERPVFGLDLPYVAYAAAPDWYLPRNQHFVVGLAPFVLITLTELALLPIIPAPAVPVIFFVAVSNAAGAVGDFAMIVWLLGQPRESLVCDTGSAITIYRPIETVDATATCLNARTVSEGVVGEMEKGQ